MLSPHVKLFYKIKRGLELVSLPHFPHNFWRKIFVLLHYISWPNFIIWLPLLCEILGNMCIAIVCKPGCDVMNFEVSLILLNQTLIFQKILFYLLQWKPFKMMKNVLYFIWKALFHLKTFKFLSWLFGHIGKMAWLKRQG